MENKQMGQEAPEPIGIRYFVAPPTRAERRRTEVTFERLAPLPPPSKKEKKFLIGTLVCICGLAVGFTHWSKFTPVTVKPPPPHPEHHEFVWAIPLAINDLLTPEIPPNNPQRNA